MKRLVHQRKDTASPLKSKKERESLIAGVTEVLNEESDDEVVESIAGIAQGLKRNAGVKEELKRFHKNVWPLIQKAQEPEPGVELGETLSSVVIVRHGKGNQKLESRLDHETHPMHNELILKKIFDYSIVNGLKNVRLVSTKWRDLSLITWREKAVLNVEKLENADVENLIKEGSEFREIPFKRYKMHYFQNEYKGVKRDILQTFGSNIQYLLLHADETQTILSALSNLPDLRVVTIRIDPVYLSLEPKPSKDQKYTFQNMRPVTPEFSKVTKLQLEIMGVMMMNMNRSGKITLTCKKIFENVPALKCLQVQLVNPCYCYRRYPEMAFVLESVLQSVREVRENGNFEMLKLEEVDIINTDHQRQTFPLTESLATNIVESRLPLHRLSIHLGIDPNASAISSLLEAHSETLQYLKFDCEPSVQYLKMNVLNLEGTYLPSNLLLPNLKELVFINGSSAWAFYTLGSLDVPNLESLKIEPKMYSCLASSERGKGHLRDRTGSGFLERSIAKLEQANRTRTYLRLRVPFLPNIKNFYYNGLRNFSASELQSIAMAMPSVTDLTICLRDNTFPTVYDLWPHLQSLHILASDKTYQMFDDYEVTGFPFQRGNDDIGVKDRVSNIRNLKDLRKFVFETGLIERFEWPRRPLLTDLSAVYGFLQLPKLRILNLETFCSFSPEVKKAFENNVIEIKIIEPNDLKNVKDAMDAEDREDSDLFWGTSEDEDKNKSDSSD